MHVPTGEIIGMSEAEMKSFSQQSDNDRSADIKRKMVELTPKEVDVLLPLESNKRKGWMRNQPCVCGSKKKFKRCCWSKFK